MLTTILIAIAAVIGAIILFGGIYLLRVYNKVKVSAVSVEEAFGGVDTILEERFDLISKLASTAKEEARLEIDLIEKVTQYRTNYELTNSIAEKIEIGQQVDKLVPLFSATREAYPDANFNEAFRQVQFGILKVEDKLSAARRNYNASVARHNKLIVVFPANIVAGMFRFTEMPMFEATEHKRDDIDLDAVWAK